jgi:hypothetical protein
MNLLASGFMADVLLSLRGLNGFSDSQTRVAVFIDKKVHLVLFE